MKRQIAIIVALALVLGALPAFAEGLQDPKLGVGLDLSGYYRIRYDNFFGAGWATGDEDSEWTEYIDQRFRLDPTIIVGDLIYVHTQIDMLRNTLLGNNLTLSEPVLTIERLTPGDDGDLPIEDVSLSQSDLDPTSVFSDGVSSTDKNGDDVPTIELTRVWGDVSLPFGRLRFGRMPMEFGMGIFQNPGDGRDDDYGDTIDRILFTTQIGPVTPGLFYDRLGEGDVTSGWTDIHQFGLDVRYAGTPVSAAAYFSYRMQDSTDTQLYQYGLWIKAVTKGFTVEAEAMAVQGSSVQIERDVANDLEDLGLPIGDGGGNISVEAFIAALDFHYEAPSWALGAGAGYSSPADKDADGEFDPQALANIGEEWNKFENDPDDPEGKADFLETMVMNQQAFAKDISTWGFDPDYNVDMLIWEELLGGQVKNGMYAKVYGTINPFTWMNVRADLIASWINQPGKSTDGDDAASDLGYELDVDLEFSVAKHFFLNLQFGGAMLGGYFDDKYDDVKNPWTMQTNFTIEF